MISLHKNVKMLSITIISVIAIILHATNALETESNFNEKFRKNFRFPSRNLRVSAQNAVTKVKENDISSSLEDLNPQAQSYFIIPETPSTSTVKTTFKRRETLRPISSLSDKSKNSKRDIIDSSLDIDISSTTSNYNPFRQIVDTGFQQDKKQESAKRRPSVNLMMMRREQNFNEGGVITLLNNENNKTNTIPSSISVDRLQIEEQGNAKTTKFGRRKHKKVGADSLPGNINEGPITVSNSGTESVSRPRKFSPQKRRFNSKVEESKFASETSTPRPTVPASVGTSNRGFTRSGRRFGGEKSKPETSLNQEILPQTSSDITEEDKPLRRRKKFTTTIRTTSDLTGNNEVQPEKPQIPNHRRVINPNIYAKRRPISPVRHSTGSTKSSFDINPTINPVDGQQESTQINRRMRHRPSTPLISSPLSPDSEQQPSDAITILADSSDISMNVNLTTSDPAAGANPIEHEQYLPSSPRNLSNRKQSSPLDKLSNRQAAARRFLTPKKHEGQQGELAATPTKAPTVTTPKTPRKSPLSLTNLRNRRLGSSSTTTTTELPPLAQEMENEGFKNLTETTEERVVGVETNGTDPVAPLPANEESTAPLVEEKPEPKGLLKNRRPIRLPGSRLSSVNSPSSVPIQSRGPILKPKTTEATTAKPTNVETTTPPTCEDGKRYNKVLRKCIPTFQRAG